MSLRSDLRFAFRALIKSPAFTAVAVTMLGLGIGINAAVFTITDAVLFKGFRFIDRNDRIVYITSRGFGCCVSYPDFEDWRVQAKSFQGMVVVHGFPVTFSDQGGFPERFDETEVSPETFRLIGQHPVMGRDFVPSDAIPGAAPVAILSYGFWERRYGKDRAVIGRAVRVNGIQTTVIGVMPEGFFFPQNQDLWTPIVPTPALEKREARDLWMVVARLAEGATIKSARVEMETIGRRLALAYPLTNQDQPPVLQSFHEFYIGRNAAMIYGSMWGAVGFVLLIACANLANLMLARAMGRSREISVRIALGAGRWRIIRQLMIESVMLSAAGGAVGWWLATAGVRVYQLTSRPPAWLDHVLDYRMDYRVFAYLIAVSMGTGLLFGLAPALRLSKLDVNTMLKDGSRGATGGGRGKHLSALLVTGEMALAVVLLAGAGVMVRSFLNISTADVGVKSANVLTMLTNVKYPRVEQEISFYDRLKTRLEAVPGVESIAFANRLPANGSMQLPFELAGDSDGQPSRPKLSALVISPGYFRTLGAAVVAGREFSDTDTPAANPVAIVNQRFANLHWPGQDPLGKRIRVYEKNVPESWRTVVGLVSNIVQNDRTRQEFDPLLYIPYRQKPGIALFVFARTNVPPDSLVSAFRHEVEAIDSDLAIFGLTSLAETLENGYRNHEFLSVLFLTFAAIALVLASLGLYAVVAHSVSQRTQEIGIRMAIGGTARDILKLVLAQGMFPMALGLGIGLAASFGVNRVLQAELVQVSPADPVALAAASAVLIFAAMLGCFIPARRAMRVDPVVALRHD